MSERATDHFFRLYDVVKSRRGGDVEKSYIARKFSKGVPHIAQKVGEEAVETAIAAVQGDKPEIVNESADLLFHLLILWAACEITPEEVFAEIKRREGISGLDEKANRKIKE